MPPPVAPRVRACHARCSGACHESPPADRRTPRHCAPQSSPARGPRSWQGSCPDPGRICSWLRSLTSARMAARARSVHPHTHRGEPDPERRSPRVSRRITLGHCAPVQNRGGLLHSREIDWVIMGVYFVFVLGIGYTLRRYMKTSTDYFLSGRSIPAWVAGLAFLSANLGAQEVIGMAASGAKYGMATSHFYWVGAIPAMVFLGVFMMPFYYGSQARSVPEYLKLRFDEKTRGLNAISFATMTVFSSGISMYAMGLLLNLLLGWDFDTSVWLSAAVVLVYILLGGLTSAIYNEVLQFFLIVFGFAPLVFLGLKDLGGWQGLSARLTHVATSQGFAPQAWSSTWSQMGDATSNPMGVEWFGVAMGLGFVLSFGYWCTDFLVVQRAMAAHSMSAARRTPLIAAVPKMFFPFLVIVPGMIAIASSVRTGASGFVLPHKADGTLNYDLSIPIMLSHYFPHGMLGPGPPG